METVNIKIELDIITHESVREHPYVIVSLDNESKWSGFCEHSKTIEFDADITDGEHTLSVAYTNKDPKTDVIIEQDEIVADKRVEIASILFDDIALDWFSFDTEETLVYTPTDTDALEAYGFDATKLSWNGQTTLHFTNPVYIWLLENL